MPNDERHREFLCYSLVPIRIVSQPFVQLTLEFCLELITTMDLTLRYAHNGYRMNKKTMK